MKEEKDGWDLRHKLAIWFTYHKPEGDQPAKYEAIRMAGLNFAQTILDNTPVGADQSAAIRKVREAVMTANAGIACNGA